MHIVPVFFSPLTAYNPIVIPLFSHLRKNPIIPMISKIIPILSPGNHTCFLNDYSHYIPIICPSCKVVPPSYKLFNKAQQL